MADTTDSTKGTWRLRVSVLLSVVGMLVVSVLIAPRLGFVRSLVLEEAIERTNSSLDGSVEVGELTVLSWTSIVAKDVVVRDKRGNVVARAGRIGGRWSLSPLATSAVVVDEVEVTQVDAVVRRYADGGLNVSEIAAPSEDESPPPEWLVVLEDAALKGNVAYWDETVAGAPPDALDELEDGVIADLGRLTRADRDGFGAVVLASLELEVAATIDLTGPLSVDVTDLSSAISADGVAALIELSANDIEVRMKDAMIGIEAGIIGLKERGSLGNVRANLELAEDGLGRATLEIGAVSVRPELLELLPVDNTPRLAQPLVGSVNASLVDNAATARFDVSTEGGGNLSVSAHVADVNDLERTSWRAAVGAEGIVAEKWSPILQPFERGSIQAWARGQGTAIDLASGEAGVSAQDVTVDRYRVDAAYAGLKWKDGELVVEELRVLSPYARADARGAINAGGHTVLSLDLVSRDALAEATRGALVLTEESRGFLNLDVDLHLDFEADEPARMVTDGQVKAKWDIAEFGAEDITIASSSGDVEVRVDRANDGGSRRFTALVDAAGTELSARGYRLRSFAVDGNATSTLRPPYADASDFTGRLNSRLDLRVNGLRGPGVRAGSVRLGLDTNAKATNRFGYALDGDVKDISAGSTTVAAARTALKGEVTIGSGVRLRDVLQAVVVKGSAGIESLESEAASVRTAALELDVRGPTQNLTGRAELAARGAAAGDYDFESLVAILKLTGNRKFSIEADGEQAEGKTPKSLEALILGSYSADLKSYTIDEVRFASGGQKWTFSDGFSFSPERGEYRFENVVVTHDDQKVRLDGYFRQGRDQDVTVEAEDLSIADIRSTLGLEAGPDEPAVKGRVSIDARLYGTSREPRATFDVWIRDLYVDEQGPFDLHLVGTYGDDLLDVTTLEALAYDQNVLAGSARVPFSGNLEGKGEVLWEEPFMIRARVPKLDIGSFGSSVPMLGEVGAKGTVEGFVDFEGRLRRPTVKLRFSAENLETDGEFGEKPLALGPYDVGLDANYSPAPRGGDGSLKASAVLGTELRKSPLVKAAAELELDVPGWLEDAVEGADVDWQSRLLDLPYVLSMNVDKFDLRSLGLATLTEADAEGLISVDATGEGTLGQPTLSVDAKLDDFGWERYRDVVFDLEGDIRSDEIELRKLRLEWDADEIFSGTGRIPLPIRSLVGAEDLSDLPLQLRLQFARVPVAKLQAVDYTFASIRGTIGGYVMVDGRLSEPEVTSRFSIVDTMFADKSVGTIAIDFGAGADRVDLAAQICRGADPVVDIRASVPLNLDIPAVAGGEPILKDGAVSGRMVASRVDLASLIPEKILDRFMNQIRGQLSADVKLAGTMEEPRVLGDLRVADAAVFIAPYGRRFEEIDLDMSFRPDGIRLKELELRDGKGLLEATGKLGMVAFKPDDLRLRVRTEELNTGGFTPFPMFIDSEIDTTGVFEDGLFDGGIDVSGLQVKIPETSDADAYPTEISPDIVFAAAQSSGDGSGFLSLDDLDAQTQQTGQPYARFTVEIARDSWVRHPIGDVNLTGSLDVELAPAGTTVGGEVEALRGDFELLGKRFEVRRGVVTFTGANPPNPRIDVEAVYLLDRSLTESIGQPTSGNPRVIVSVSGVATKPELKLSSDPQMPEDDIIYVLVTNRPPQSSGVGEREGVANTALSAASGIFAGLLQQKLQDSIPVDVLRVETGEDGFTDYRVEAGKYLTDTLFLSLRYQFGAEPDENSTSISVEYRFAPRWTVELEAGDKANGEANIFWDVY